MVMDRTIAGAGTSEEAWRLEARLDSVRHCQAAQLLPPEARVVLCAPHPDDEILPCAGALRERGEGPLTILAITNGEMSHPRYRDVLREARPRETLASIEALGIVAEIERLGFPDGGLEARLPALTQSIAEHLCPGDHLISPWGLDGHPDHEATYHAAAAAAKLAGAAPPIEVPIWGWHWCSPGRNPFPWSRAVKVPLSFESRERKQRAIAQFSTQISPLDGEAPILSEQTLRRFYRPWELFFSFQY